MAEKPKHTAVPWHVYRGGSLDNVWRAHRTVAAYPQGDAEHGGIAVAYCDYHTPEIAEANAAFIVRAANCHADLLAACLAMIAWDDAEKAGPSYGTFTRGTHPDGEAIWRDWWNDQQRLCARAFDTARAAIAKATA